MRYTVLIVVALGLLVAATKGDTPKASSGAVNVLLSPSVDGGSAAPTKVFTGLSGRNAFAVYNNGPNTLWCGWVSNVTTATGFPVVAGGTLSVDVVWEIGGQDFYCTAATADQASPANTRWIQVK